MYTFSTNSVRAIGIAIATASARGGGDATVSRYVDGWVIKFQDDLSHEDAKAVQASIREGEVKESICGE